MIIEATEVVIESKGVMTHRSTTAAELFDLVISADTLLCDADSSIDVTGKGYLVGRTEGNTTAGGASGVAGGSYGGRGFGPEANQTYGEDFYPHQPGSGGGTYWQAGGAGGGILHLFVDQITVEGTVKANGGNGFYNGDTAGSGGSITISGKTLSGNGLISANGGAGYGSGGSGGGGRIALYVRETLSLPEANITAKGGTGGAGTGQDGTVLIPTEPAFCWVSLEQAFLHGSADLTWTALGLDSSAAVSVDIAALGMNREYAIATDATVTGTVSWNTMSLDDGVYILQATFKDDAGQVIGEANQSVVINNTAIWHSGEITANETWTAEKVHVVEDDVSIAAGVTLVILPETIVKFTRGSRFIVEEDGILEAEGTAAQKIYLTSLADDAVGGDTNQDGSGSIPQPGDWAGFSVRGTGQLITNEFVDIRYGENQHAGSLSADETWTGDFMHHVTGHVIVPSGITLRIDPGAVVKFNDKLGIDVQAGGKLEIQGTPAKPVTLTSIVDDSVGGDTNGDGDRTAPQAGDWKWLNMDGAQADIRHAHILYAGGTVSGVWDSGIGAGAIRTKGSADVTVSNCLIRDAFFDGVLAWGGTVTILNSVFSGTDRAVCAHPGGVVHVVNTTVDDNRIGLLIHGGTLNVANTIVTNSYRAGILRDYGSDLLTIRYSNIYNADATDGNYSGTADRTGTDGNISVDPTYKNPATGNFRLKYLSPCIDAADGKLAPDEDFMGAPRYDDPRTPNTGVEYPEGVYADMGAFEFVESAESDLDLVVDWVSGPLEVTAGDNATVSWQIRNIGTGWVLGSWHDRISLLADAPSRGVAEIILDEVLSNGPLGPGQSAIFKAAVRVPGGTEGPWRWRVKANAQGEVFEGINWRNNMASPSYIVQMHIRELINDTPTSGAFVGIQTPDWLKCSQAAGEELVVDLNLDSTEGKSRIYAGFGTMPTTADFDLRSPSTIGPDVRLALPAPGQARTVYLLYLPESLPGGNYAYTIEAQTPQFGIEAVSPARAGNTGRVTLTLTGALLEPGLKARLRSENGSTIVYAERVTVQNSLSALATFNLTGRPEGVYDMIITQDETDKTLSSGLTVVQGTGGILKARLILPETVRVGRPFDGIVEYANVGDANILVPLLVIQGTGDNPVWLEGECPSCSEEPLEREYLQLIGIPTDGLSAGVLPPGKTYTLTFRTVSRVANASYKLLAKEGGLAELLDWEGLKTAVRPPSADAVWDEAWNALETQVGPTYGEYIAALAQGADEARGYDLELYGVLDILDYLIQRELTEVDGVSVAGTVTHAVTGEPLDQVLIRMQNIDTDETATTASWYNGRFLFRSLAAGTYRLTVAGYIPTPWSLVYIPETGLAESLDVSVSDGATVSGMITGGGAGAPAEGAVVTLRQEDTGVLYTAVSDSEGRFSITGLTSGTGTLSVVSDDLVPSGSQTVSLTEGEVTGFSLVLQSGAFIEGRVLAPGGGPLADARVGVVKTDQEIQKTATTDEDGQYRIDGLEAGTYDLTATASGYGAVERTAVQVTTEGVSGIDLTLAAAGSIRLSVTDAANQQSLEGARAVTNAPGVDYELVFSDAQGEIVLSGLAAGDYTVTVSADDYLTAYLPVTVMAGQTVDMAAALDKSGSIRGRVVTVDGDPLYDFPVSFYWKKDELSEIYKPSALVVTDEDGYFGFLGLREGTYGVAAGVYTGFRPEIQSHVIDHANKDIETTLNVDFAELQGQVFKAGGVDPVEGAEVHLVFNEQVVETAYTDEAGNYRFWILQGGTYDVAVRSPEVGFVRLNDVAVTLGDILAGQDLIGGGSALEVSVSATAQGLSQVDGAAVIVSPADPWPGSEKDIWLFTDETGQVALSSLQPGSYEVRVLGDGLAPQKVTVSVSGTLTQQAVDLASGRSMQGKVTDGAGDPVSNAMIMINDTEVGTQFITATGEDGTYSSASLPQTSFDVWITDGDHQPYVVRNLSIGSTEPHTLNATLSDNGYMVDGVLEDGNQQPVTGVSIEVAADGVTLFETISASDGTYRIGPLGAGEYVLSFTGDGVIPQTQVLTITGDQSLDAVVLSGPVAFPDIYTGDSEIMASRSIQSKPQTGLPQSSGNSFLQTVGNVFRAGYRGAGAVVGDLYYRVETLLLFDTYEWMLDGMPMIDEIPQRMPYDNEQFRRHQDAIYSAFFKQVPPYPNRSCSFTGGYVHKAYEDCVASSALIDQTYLQLLHQHQYLNSVGANEAAIVMAEGLKIGLDASMLLISLQKFIPGGEQQWLQVPQSWVEQGIDPNVAAQAIKDIKQLVVGPLNIAVRECYERIMRGDWRGAESSMKSLKSWMTSSSIHVIERMISEKFPDFKGKGLFKNHFFKKTLKAYSIVKDFIKWYDNQSTKFTNEQKGVLSAIGQWWSLYNGYQEALKKHNQNLNELVKKADQCLKEHSRTLTFEPPPQPAGMQILNRPPGVRGVGSVDPNVKYTVGVGPEGYITGDATIQYVIMFENMATASAAAYQVTVTDDLDEKLDYSTFELASIGFNKVEVEVPPGLQSFTKEGIAVVTDSNPVRITAQFDEATGRAHWVIESVDAVTGELPDDPLAGFLPPNDSEHRGEGYVSFRIRPKANLPSGTVIQNKAAIVFDVNDPIWTDELYPLTTNTIDIESPVSQVLSLPSQTTGRTVTINLTGGDDGGSGISAYSIYVSDNGAPYRFWQSTANTSVEFTGSCGHVYRFYSVATDQVGNVENAPLSPDTLTMIKGTPGDMNEDTNIDLSDAIATLQAIAKKNATGSCATNCGDVDGDNRIGLGDLIYVLQSIAGLR
ncbi:MAG: carboxypeptidase regulatory-like domain-containing protein [Deltaproteobacteria bacterium]|nr:carboxypeptidase regulatory-like domain-containing protein [Deltaproteobacteria bacterium]